MQNGRPVHFFIRAFVHSCIPAFVHSCIPLFPSVPRRPSPLRSSRTVLRRLRAASRTPDARAGLSILLAIGPSDHTARLRPLRRSAADLEGDQRAAGAMPALPARHPPGGSRACRRCLRRRVARDRSRAQIRRAAFAGAAVGGADAPARRRHADGRRLGGSCAASPFTAARARVQSGRGSGAPCRRPCSAGASPHESDQDASRASCGAASSQRPRCVRARFTRAGRERPRPAGAGRFGRGPDRRCEHDGRHARCLRASPQGGRRTGSACAYGSASRDATALNTSAATSSLARSPASTIQPAAAACAR